MSDARFIGLGRNPNPDVPDIPEGFGAALSGEPEARVFFESLSDAQKSAVIFHIQNNNTTGSAASSKITNTVAGLKRNNLDFLR